MIISNSSTKQENSQKKGINSSEKTRGSFEPGIAEKCPLAVQVPRIEPKIQFNSAPAEVLVLDQEEIKLYGNRFPKNYKKIKLLGKGGQAVVWLAECVSTGRKFAIKQLAFSPMFNQQQSRREIEINQIIFSKDNPSNYTEDGELSDMGKQFLIQIVDQCLTPKDLFLILQIGGSSLSRLIYTFKGEFFKSERIYQITNHEIFHDLRQNSFLLKDLLTKLLLGLHTIHQKKLVHCDLKPENILVVYDQSNQQITDLKIIDFGAAYTLEKNPFLSVTTPEYLPPEYLMLFSDKNQIPNLKKVAYLREKCTDCNI